MKSMSKKMLFTLPLGLLLCLCMFLAACSTEPPPAANGGTTPQATATPTTGGSTQDALIKTAQVDVKGTTKAVLTDAQGRTLYYFKPDTIDTVACTGDCADNWPPLVYTGSGTPTSDPALPGTLGTHSNANGNQVFYNNHYLYTFAGDTAAGQANGEGVGGKWYVATPDLQ
ncbi:MAG TPA: hypothetical protein VFN35_03280 [Ktedonobacteraceae bacterium]|nr:hypothetical protein [Ktedonobacteraceae bacterium]